MKLRKRTSYGFGATSGAAIALAFLVSPWNDGRAADDELPVREAYVLLEAPADCDFRKWRDELAASGIQIAHAFPPVGGIAAFDSVVSIPAMFPRVPSGTVVHSTSPTGVDAERLRATDPGRILWSAHRALSGLVESRQAQETPIEGAHLIGDGLEPPPTADRSLLWACDDIARKRTGSDYLLGSVSVNLILPESNGALDPQTETWNETRELEVGSRVVSGLNSLRNLYPPNFPAAWKPTFTYHAYVGRTDARAQTSYEPITRNTDSGHDPGIGEGLWIRQILLKLGYSSAAGKWDMAREFNGDTRESDGTHWAFTIFVVDSLNDVDGRFVDYRFAYAWLGGPYTVMTYDNAGYGITKMQDITRHEVGHIFHALDEYVDSECSCDHGSGYVIYTNENCIRYAAPFCPSNVSCVMRDNVAAMCSFTRGMIGWGDYDADRVPDPVDIEPSTQLDAQAPDSTSHDYLSYSGTAAVRAVPAFFQCDRNVLRIGQVQWRLDTGPWQNAIPTDGAFDSGTEGYQFTVGPLSYGPHTIEARAIDELSQADSTPASDSVTIVGAHWPGDDLIVDFGSGIGLWVYADNSSWTPLLSVSPEIVVTGDLDDNAQDEVIVDLGASGIWIYDNNSSWRWLHDLSPSNIGTADLNGNGKEELLVDFGVGSGLWTSEYGIGWKWLHGLSPKQFIAADVDGNGQDDLVVDFGPGNGVWVYKNDTSWSWLHGLSPESMTRARLNGNALDDLVVDFGAGLGVYILYDGESWYWLHGLSPESIEAGDIDGSGIDELVVNFGTANGVWIYENATSWRWLHGLSPQLIRVADLNRNGKADLVVGFGEDFGLYVYTDGATWSLLHVSSPVDVTVGDLNGAGSPPGSLAAFGGDSVPGPPDNRPANARRSGADRAAPTKTR